MKLIRKTFTQHGAIERHILSPVNEEYEIVAGDDKKGFYIIIGNGSGYKQLKDYLLLAAELRDNELIYLPIHNKIDEYKNTFDCFDFYNGIYLMNYCQTQSSIKNMAKLKNIKTYKSTTVERNVRETKKKVEHWQVHNRLTINMHKRDLFIYGNRDCFYILASGAKALSEYGDDIKYNDLSPHCHYDWLENTSKSKGITLYYWHNQN